MSELINKAMLSFKIIVILINMATINIATEILLFLISLNSFVPVVRIEKSRNTEALITTDAIKPISK